MSRVVRQARYCHAVVLYQCIATRGGTVSSRQAVIDIGCAHNICGPCDCRPQIRAYSRERASRGAGSDGNRIIIPRGLCIPALVVPGTVLAGVAR